MDPLTTEESAVSAESAPHGKGGQAVEMHDDNNSGEVKFVGPGRRNKKRPVGELLAKEKKGPALLGSTDVEDSVSECDCAPTPEERCGIPGESISVVSECTCEEPCETPLEQVVPEKLDDTAKYSDIEKQVVAHQSDQLVDKTVSKGKKTKFNFNVTPFENTGQLQSPIDINLNDLVVKNYPALEFSTMYYELPDRMFTVIQNSTYEVCLKYTRYASPRMSSGPLNSPYKFLKFVFHWGSDDDRGSEHTIDGKAHVMELHAVHIQEQLNKETARTHKNGFAILGYFIKLGETDHPVIAALLDNFQCLDNMNVPNDQRPHLAIQRPFSVSDLIDTFSDSYLTYEGSLTTEPYSENATWILSPYCIRISSAQMARFRSLKGVEPNNFRQIQQRHNRVVNLVEREDNVFRRLTKS